MGKSSGSSGNSTIRYAPFLEDAAEALIARGDTEVSSLLDESPFSDITLVNPDDAFLGTGYAISDFPSLFDMYGKLMAALDIEVLHDQAVTGTTYSAPIAGSIDAEAAIIDADLNANAYPRFEAGMTTMNAAMSTGFMMGRAYIEDGRTRALTKYAADLRIHAMNLGHQRWMKHLEWNAQVIAHYLSILKAYLNESTQYVSTSVQLDSADKLWNFTVLDHQRAIVGVLNNAAAAQVKKDSGLNSAISGVLGIASLLTAPMSGGSSLAAGGMSALAKTFGF